MAVSPVFVSVVFVVRNLADAIHEMLADAIAELSPVVSDFEVIVVDNGSNDETVSTLRRLTGEGGLPNLQVFCLTKEVDIDTASWVGLENALGDFTAVIDLVADDVSFLPRMLHSAMLGADVVFARNEATGNHGLAYRVSGLAFNLVYKSLNGIDLARDAPQFRLLSKRVIHYILQFPQPSLSYRHLPATGGFSRVHLSYCAPPVAKRTKYLLESVDRGMRLIVSTTNAPMRIVTVLSLFGALANVVYSVYVILIGLLKDDVAPGWMSLSLQQSGMFFLISLVLLVLREYILNMVRLSNEGPQYYVAQEFTSVRMTRREKLNIDDAQARQMRHVSTGTGSRP